MTTHSIVIVGGGYTGAAFAIHLSRAARTPLAITVIESRGRVGGGLAYSTRDPDHRLNAPDTIHLLFPDDPEHFRNWLHSEGRLECDPEAQVADGVLFPRRHNRHIKARIPAHRPESGAAGYAVMGKVEPAGSGIRGPSRPAP